jgi:fumarate hydratase class II
LLPYHKAGNDSGVEKLRHFMQKLPDSKKRSKIGRTHLMDATATNSWSKNFLVMAQLNYGLKAVKNLLNTYQVAS